MEWNHEAIKFYSAQDWGAGHHLRKVEDLLKTFEPQTLLGSIDECLELYNVKKFIDAGLRFPEWSDVMVDSFKDKCRKIPGLIGKFLGAVNDSNILDYYDMMNGVYEDNFWEIACEYKLYERISAEKLDKLLSAQPRALGYALRHKKIVLHHGKVLSSQLEANVHTAERLMSHYLVAHENDQVACYFPSEFTQEKRDQILWQYVESDDANPNYLALLWQAQSTAEFPVSDRLRLKAKKQHEAATEKLFAERPGMSYGAEIGFTSRPDYSTDESYTDRIYHALYSREWLKDNLDYPTLLNNFIYLFGYVDRSFRCAFTSLQSKLGVFERHLGIKGVKDYQTGVAFNMDRMRTILQMQAYKQELEKLDVRIEDIFKWFFEVYLQEEFGAKGFTYTPPSEHTTPAEKCKLLAISIDGVLKQYRLFLEDGFVDRELLEMSSGHIVFSEIRSMVDKKYAYSKSDELQREQFILYSDQSIVTYTDKTQSRYDNLPKMLLLEEMAMEDFHEYQQGSLNWLLKRGTIGQEPTGKLTINKGKVVVLKDLFANEVVCPSYYGQWASEIQALVVSGDMEYENTLFSRPEQAYLNYMLNKSEYSNGLDLRNKYSHDTCSLKEEVQIQDYIELLKIMVLIIIKINEEFCLREMKRSPKT